MKNKVQKNSFKIPDNYFENLDDQIFLHTITNKTSFITPHNYFDDLEQDILAQNIPAKKSKLIDFNIWWAAACIILIALVAIPFVMNIREEKAADLVENQVYEKIYDSYIAVDQNKKSSNVTLDDSDYALYDY
ncbi:hypothetical protein [Empedobacter sedimenti]|uniref:hypothetical protein n=1 Tax=Empedobacter sedimenti TaxID=3042610 RepID=UPI0024A71C5A|nr:hypothetical protein [Empedobacter sedimenti]